MLAVDGNFHLHRNKKGKVDHPLTRNAGFWVDDGEFDDYIDAKGARPDSAEKVSVTDTSKWTLLRPIWNL